jgi:hypothetical protein
MPVKYGWPLPKRQDYFLDISSKPLEKRYDYSLQFMGRECILPVWCIPSELPKYRLLNGRTSSLQQEWLAKNSIKPKDFFDSDPERDEAQKVQHDLLKTLINDADLYPFFKNPENKQTEIIILDNLGFVVNGNRRLCTWRELLNEDATKYKHFEYVDVVVLPKADDRAIDELEAKLQVKKDILADYSWHALANMLYRRKQKKVSDEALIEMYGLTGPRQIEEYLDMREYALEYMKNKGKEGHWSIVDDKSYAFKELVKMRKQQSSPGEKRIMEVGAFALLDAPEGGRLYSYIPDMYKYQDSIQTKLLEEFPMDTPLVEEDPLGTDLKELVNLNLSSLINKDDESRKKAAVIIKEAIETNRSLDKEKDSAGYVLKQLHRASASIQSAVLGIRPESLKEGVKETIQTIEVNIAAIKKWLS